MRISAPRNLRRGRGTLLLILAPGLLPLVVGGTGLYIRALTRGLFPAPEKSEELRAQLRHRAEQGGKGIVIQASSGTGPAVSAENKSP